MGERTELVSLFSILGDRHDEIIVTESNFVDEVRNKRRKMERNERTSLTAATKQDKTVGDKVERVRSSGCREIQI